MKRAMINTLTPKLNFIYASSIPLKNFFKGKTLIREMQIAILKK